MRNESYNLMGTMWVRIPKAVAHKLYVCNIPLLIAPCKYRLDSPGGCGFYCKKTDQQKELGFTPHFRQLVSEYEYYNCNNELGRYAKFFVNQYDLTSYELELSKH